MKINLTEHILWIAGLCEKKMCSDGIACIIHGESLSKMGMMSNDDDL